MLYEIRVPRPLADGIFVYEGPDDVRVGQLVMIPWGKHVHFVGLVLRSIEKPPPGVVPRPIDTVLPFFFSPAYAAFLQAFARYNCVHDSIVLKAVLGLGEGNFFASPRKGYNVRGRFFRTQKEAVEALGRSWACLKANAKRQTGPESYKEKKQTPQSVALTAAQREAVDVWKSGFHVLYLDGVTASGKTEVYLSWARSVLDEGKQVLLLFPEIALTEHMRQRVADRLGLYPAVWHASVSKAEKRIVWQGVLRGEVRCVMGARSALFLPFKRVGLVVVDESHDQSYKQEQPFCYQGRDMAVLLGRHMGATVILSTATPSLETWHNVVRGKYRRVSLPSRFSGTLPAVHVVDLRGVRELLHPRVCQAVEETLAVNRQVLFHVHRRGYAPVTQCFHCGVQLQCKACSVAMVYHRAEGKLLCHLCGFNMPLPSVCPKCGKEGLVMTGMGVERVAETLERQFPRIPMAIVSSDVVGGRRSIGGLLNSLARGDPPFIVGTRMLTKGFHLPNLKTVVVVRADQGFSGPDFRAAERAFQDYLQVAGRAGRSSNFSGDVWVQSYSPESPFYAFLRDYQRDVFLDYALKIRKTAGWPPQTHLLSILLRAKNSGRIQEYARVLKAYAPREETIGLLGPAPAPIPRIGGETRYRFLVRGPGGSVQRYAQKWLRAAPKPPPGVRIDIDVDPYYFM